MTVRDKKSGKMEEVTASKLQKLGAPKGGGKKTSDSLGQKLRNGDAVTVKHPDQGPLGGTVTDETTDSEGKVGFTVHGHNAQIHEMRVHPSTVMKNGDKAKAAKQAAYESQRASDDAAALKEAENWSVQQLQNELINLSENHLPDPGFQKILDRKTKGTTASGSPGKA